MKDPAYSHISVLQIYPAGSMRKFNLYCQWTWNR